MKFGRILVLSLAALLIAAPAAHAQRKLSAEDVDPARSGPMLGVGAVFALENFGGIGMGTDNSGAFNAHVGYRFNPEA